MNIKIILILFLSIGCSNPRYKHCDDLLGVCSGKKNSQYCLFGFKYGESPQFQNSGEVAIGPKKSGGIITYSFHTKLTRIDTHSQKNIQTQDFDGFENNPKSEIIRALEEWEKYGNFDFENLKDNSSSDIRFVIAEIKQGAIGWPNFQDELCSSVSGRIVIQNLVVEDSDKLFIIALHEIGHALGLGHVSSRNIMNPSVTNFEFTGLQAGDLEGIESIYGKKTENNNGEHP